MQGFLMISIGLFGGFAAHLTVLVKHLSGKLSSAVVVSWLRNCLLRYVCQQFRCRNEHLFLAIR